MIEEEKSPEEILKRKITWKSVLKNIITFIMLFGAFILITYFSSAETLGSTGMFLGITLLCIASSLMVPMDEDKKDLKHTLTMMKCEKCSKTIIKDFQEGDYVFKSADNCPQCNVPMKIQEIYQVKLKMKEKASNKGGQKNKQKTLQSK